MYYVVAAEGQHVVGKIGWIILKMGPCLGVCLNLSDDSEELNVVHAGMATGDKTRKNKPRCSYETRMSTNTANSDDLQNDHGCEHSTCKLCLKVSQQNGEFGQSTTSCAEMEECLDVTQENIRLQQENDAVIKHLLKWKRDNDKPAWSTVAPHCRELKAYWHEWDTIVIKDNILYKKRLRDVGNDAEYLILVPKVLRKEVFRQLHEYITAGHLGRRKTYDKIKKRFYWCNMHKRCIILV